MKIFWGTSLGLKKKHSQFNFLLLLFEIWYETSSKFMQKLVKNVAGKQRKLLIHVAVVLFKNQGILIWKPYDAGTLGGLVLKWELFWTRNWMRWWWSFSGGDPFDDNINNVNTAFKENKIKCSILSWVFARVDRVGHGD